MSTIVTRAGKGSALTHVEVDANFTNLNTDKIQSGNTVAALTITSATINGGTITGITDLAVADGGTGLSTLTAGYIPFGAGTSAFGSSANLFWDNTNSRLGIGTSAPTTKLTISANTTLPSAGAITGTGLWQVPTDATVNAILLDSFGSGGSSTIAGRRSAGTAASPTAIGANGTIVSISAYGYGATGYSSTSKAAINLMSNEAWSDTAQGTRITFSTTGNGTTTTSEKMRIDDAGNVGIGTTSPLSRLQLTYGTGESGGLKLAQSGWSYYTRFGAVGSSGDDQYWAGNYNVAANTVDSSGQYASYIRQNLGSGYISLATSSAANAVPTERMRIDSSGNVGIGTTSPSSFAKLAIVGTTATNLFQMATAGNTSGLYMTPSDGGQFSLNSYGSGLTINSTTSTGVVTVGTNNTERMRIDSSGNLGIGTSSPSASAILDAQSTTKGVRMPNMTTTQKNAISSPAAGLIVFDTTLAKLCVYSGSAWQTITSV